jgi:GNAT superfamily N-acetyltransferase
VTRAHPGAWGIVYRPATADDVPACGEIWRDALNDYLVRLGQPAVGEDLRPIGRLHEHLRATDPERFWVAVRERRVIGFGSAILRGRLWFLSMLFVRPDDQRLGVGRSILDAILPGDEGLALATGTDSAQPISNGLYAGLGMVPRMPLLSVVGRPDAPGRMPPLPAGVRATSVDGSLAGEEGPDGGALDALDREVVGFQHPQDHRWLRAEGRQPFLYCGADGAVVGYGYTSSVGRIGPVAVRDRALLAPVLGHLLTAIEPRGASAVWLPGHAGEAATALVRAGLRLEGFPVLLCWNRPFADFERYVPISPGLL